MVSCKIECTFCIQSTSSPGHLGQEQLLGHPQQIWNPKSQHKSFLKWQTSWLSGGKQRWSSCTGCIGSDTSIWWTLQLQVQTVFIHDCSCILQHTLLRIKLMLGTWSHIPHFLQCPINGLQFLEWISTVGPNYYAWIWVQSVIIPDRVHPFEHLSDALGS